ncbi:hypothetical protein LRR81_15345 [Metabacillus sp. GX 13764]|uniref:hypothetical protein n=1 Tax=Metabacillus kandeliae TaxID=2900151 RepID=UPI001E2D1934|nr:hypothetical protein [Metabacillus kandeliae]MCD7035619.1 hypothetical protein [Metabacillus kandeliae]
MRGGQKLERYDEKYDELALISPLFITFQQNKRCLTMNLRRLYAGFKVLYAGFENLFAAFGILYAGFEILYAAQEKNMRVKGVSCKFINSYADLKIYVRVHKSTLVDIPILTQTPIE